MVPQNNVTVKDLKTSKAQTSNTFYLRRGAGYISGLIDGLESVRQAVYLALNVERYNHEIYSWNYGAELSDLFGKSAAYVCAALPDRIREALSADDRITEVAGFSFTRKRGTVTAEFTVKTLYGDIRAAKEVRVDV